MTHTGILNIDKPSGWTSHDVVGKVRRLLGQKSVGHAGTLDPLATGVLLVCVGQATRVTEYLMAGQKHYRATVQLGLETDTYDIEGDVTATTEPPPLSVGEIEAALRGFTGAIEQTPPVYSAIKQAGVPAYRRARRGEEMSLPSRSVTVYRIDCLEWSTPYVTFEVTCDPGTYIRSLAYDLGRRLGCGGTLTALRRLRSGSFRVEDAISLEMLAHAAESGQVAACLHPLRTALSSLTPVQMDEGSVARLTHGLPVPAYAQPATPEGCALGPDGAVVAIVAYDASAGHWRPRKVFGAGTGASVEQREQTPVDEQPS
jgi:tRNA pseudouridine55 synthase